MENRILSCYGEIGIFGGGMNREKIAQVISKAIFDRKAGTLAEREKIYAAARLALAKQSGGDPFLSRLVDDVIKSVEASYKPKPVDRPAAGISGNRNSAVLFAGGVAVGLALMALAAYVFSPVMGSGSETVKELEQQYQNSLPQVPIAIDYLRNVSDAVIAMQKTDRAGLEAKAATTFISVRDLMPELSAQMPASLPPGSDVVVRADGFDFKILFNWTVCGTVLISNPDMVDRIRYQADVVGCPYFGLWTPGAADW